LLITTCIENQCTCHLAFNKHVMKMHLVYWSNVDTNALNEDE